VVGGPVDDIGFDGLTHRGEPIVPEHLVQQVITIFERPRVSPADKRLV
jgi:hypothetical protein